MQYWRNFQTIELKKKTLKRKLYSDYLKLEVFAHGLNYGGNRIIMSEINNKYQ